MNQSLKNVVLDTATLVPAGLRDTLLRAVDKRLFMVYWSEDTIVELRRTLVQKLKIQRSNVDYLIQEMQKHFPYATIPTQQYSGSLNQMQNDPKDRHVLAAAVVANASIIVTPNLKDFPQSVLQPLNVQALSPDDFLEQIFTDFTADLVQIIQEQAADTLNPPLTVAEVLEALKVPAPKTAKLLQEKLIGSI